MFPISLENHVMFHYSLSLSESLCLGQEFCSNCNMTKIGRISCCFSKVVMSGEFPKLSWLLFE